MAKSKSKLRASRTAEELQRASLAVQYELSAISSSHHMLQELGATWESDSRDKALSNALLNAFLIAARNLLSFLYAHYPRPTDIIAEDYFDDPSTWYTTRPTPEPELVNGELIDQISKRLAHLTWSRAEITKPLWGPFKIIWNITSVLQVFVRQVPSQTIHPQLCGDVEVIAAILQSKMDQWGGELAPMAPHKAFIEFDDLVYFELESEFED
jgi:hypothetical protein